ncbi:DUF389 domain-containing protein [Pseudanabaena sp. FACHB-2040]|uniref:DUF389 domain-containing protein n=1 Tax=Pseudanabaena sp. FACHB-2040 TaxID=2692859 RepID=UPI0016820137|nr:DUF389 domain-containing protein [Pseudanabaena sp. FACHB-2040]MBD2257321.1 DUF389 domain-containing protein [Pseudanabaena sp. FACHB-2040]
MKFSYPWRRRIVRLRRWAGTMTQSNSGDWFWLKSKPVLMAGLSRDLWRWAEPTPNYYILLLLSVIISTLGLLANSSATIIGAMIIAPLMGPIIAIAFAMTLNNRRLLKRASFSVITGAVLGIGTASLITVLLGLASLTPEIEARSVPTLIDLGVALAAGAAGAYAKSRRHIADALPGVAISVALVPPLSVIGIGLALPSRDVALGASLMLLTNLAGIIFSGALIFIWQGYGTAERAKRGLTLSVLALTLLGLPLGLSFRDLAWQQRTRTRVYRLVEQSASTNDNFSVTRLSVQRQQTYLQLHLELSAMPQSVTETEIDQLHQMLETELEQRIDLRVDVLPIARFRTTSPELSQSK